MKTSIKIKNLDCPVCARELQEELEKISGVRAVTVNFTTQSISLEADDKKTVEAVIEHTNAFEDVQVIEEGQVRDERENHSAEWLRVGIAAALLIIGLALGNLSGMAWKIVGYVAFFLAYGTVGYPVLLSTGKNLSKGRIFDENFLMTVASLGAICIGEYAEGVAVMLLYQIGETLQSIAVGGARKSVADLMQLKSERAVLIIDGEQQEVDPKQLNIGDVVFVKAGEKIPTDGVLLGEFAVLDTKSLTGESELRESKRGEELLSGCINAGAAFEMQVAKRYEDCAVSKIVELVENASAQKATPEKFMTKFAKYYTPIVCALAVAIAIFAPLINGLVFGRLYFANFERWLTSALTFLVVSCPCALVISIPLTYFSGIGSCAKNGILVKGATYLDEIATAKTVAFDKTGTLTEGEFSTLSTHTEKGVSSAELLGVIAAVEKGSAHPIAKAFSNVKTQLIAKNVTERIGCGLHASIDGDHVCVGNIRLMREENVMVDEVASVHTVIYAARSGKLLGWVEMGDKLRFEAKSTISMLKKLGFSHTVMLTGDRKERAEIIANEAGVYEMNCNLLPDEKLQAAGQLKKEGGLIYVGDGINDAPVMAVADCAVSMGKLGSAAAVEASDAVLISDDLGALVNLVRLARKTRKIVLQNIVFSIAMKVVFMVLGVIGILPLWLAVFGDVGVMLLAVLNSMRMRGKIKRIK